MLSVGMLLWVDLRMLGLAIWFLTGFAMYASGAGLFAALCDVRVR